MKKLKQALWKNGLLVDIAKSGTTYILLYKGVVWNTGINHLNQCFFSDWMRQARNLINSTKEETC